MKTIRQEKQTELSMIYEARMVCLYIDIVLFVRNPEICIC